ncbi:methyltransferase domain-containing protein [Novipirellula sp. SH528]|uniref:methyltransferase domain-containing protein n=1 Tax=Novipirellula sp. SH528 TaxID=3454466 RepID=UPI003F9FC7C3
MSKSLDTENAVASRYSAAAQAVEPALCCPVDYDASFLKIIPNEVIERDYGCGDPSKYVRKGETVLDLGSGGGKICFIASQVVGKSGRVIGVDMNDEMLTLARNSQPVVADAIGYDNITFCKGRIQDMAVDRDAVDRFLQSNPVTDEATLRHLESFITTQRREQPMIADDSVDVVVSNCVLNLVDSAEKQALFAEIFRVLKNGGRAVISDIVADQVVPEHLQQDATLWSGCISGALRDEDFVRAFEEAGFHGVEVVVMQPEPWQVVEGIEFRSATVIAYKGNVQSAPYATCEDQVMYRGPFASIRDDEGDEYRRGEMTAVYPGTFAMLSREPYASHFIRVPAKQQKQTTGLPVANQTQTYQLQIASDSPSSGSDGCCDSGGCC